MAPRRMLRPLIFLRKNFHCFATHSGWLKTPDLGQKEACNQGKEDFKQLTYSRMHSASSATGENVLQWEQLPFSKKMGKCALWGLRGRTPYKAHSTLCVSLLNLLRFLIRSRRSVVSSSSFLIRHRRRKSRN